MDLFDRIYHNKPSASIHKGWKVRIIAPASPATHLKDPSYFFSIAGSFVKMYSTTTGEIVSTLSAAQSIDSDSSPSANQEQRETSDLFTAAVLNPNNSLQLITGSLNGYIMVWDIIEAAPLQIFDLHQPITHLCVHEKFKDTVFVGASRESNSDANAGEFPPITLFTQFKTSL
jgi:NET1-associated nuclear protein 1 (U3 small nucleolar RNA-associated protein 17)